MNCIIRRIRTGHAIWKRNIYITSPTLQEKSMSNDDPIAIENPFQKEKQQCILCKYNIQPDYKNVKLLSQFQSPFTGRIYGKHITGLCTQRQAQVEKEIIKAQRSGYMPYYLKDNDFLHEPKLFDPERPLRPHNY